jgi:transposase
MFVDETVASARMVRRHGRDPRGQRLRGSMPHGHWKTSTFVGALRLNDMIAPMALDGPMNGPCFLAYVQQVLAPTLKPGDIVIMNNLAAQNRAETKDAIENAFAKLKTLLRKAGHGQSNRSGTPSPGSSRLNSSLECANESAGSGYNAG